jgi:hypothetical protein
MTIKHQILYSNLHIQENEINNSAKPVNWAEIDDFIDNTLMINYKNTLLE